MEELLSEPNSASDEYSDVGGVIGATTTFDEVDEAAL